MATKTKIKKDGLGLYVTCGGYIARPLNGTVFGESEKVMSHHFGGSHIVGVTLCDKPETHNFKRNGVYESWITTSTVSEYNKNK
jgi:hypothetical protein